MIQVGTKRGGWRGEEGRETREGGQGEGEDVCGRAGGRALSCEDGVQHYAVMLMTLRLSHSV